MGDLQEANEPGVCLIRHAFIGEADEGAGSWVCFVRQSDVASPSVERHNPVMRLLSNFGPP